MNKLPKILTIIFLSLFILQMVGLLVFLVIPQTSQAADDAISFTPQIAIPGYNGGKITEYSIGLYILAIYKYAIGIVGILATVVLMYGGIRWLTSGGSSEKIGDAKAWIGAALSGLVLALASFLILNTINPELVKIQSINPDNISKVPQSNIRGSCKVGEFQIIIGPDIRQGTIELCTPLCEKVGKVYDLDYGLPNNDPISRIEKRCCICKDKGATGAPDPRGCCVYDFHDNEYNSCINNISERDCKKKLGGKWSVGYNLECYDKANINPLDDEFECRTKK